MKLKIVILSITTIIILTVYFMVIPVKATTLSKELKTIVLLVGTSECNLEEEGYTVVNNELDLNRVGSYEVVYQHNDTEELINREVFVIDQNGYYSENMVTIETFNDYQMELLSSVSYGNNKHLLIVKFITDIEKNIGHVFMYTVENNKVIKSVNLFFNVDLIVNDLKIVNDHFIMTGKMWNSLYGNYDSFIRVNSLNGLLIFSEMYGGSNEDSGKRIIETDDAYMVFGKTSSNDLDFVNNSLSENNYLMTINKNDKTIKNIVYYQDNIDFEHLYLKKRDSDILLCYDTLKNMTKIIKIDDSGNIKEIIENEKNSDEHLVDILDNEQNTLVYSNNNKLITKTKEEVINIELKGEIKELLTEEDLISLLLYNEGRYIYTVINNGEVIYELLLDDSEYKLIKNGVIIKDNNFINVYNINYLLINDLGNYVIDTTNQEYHDYEIIMNGKKIKHNDKTIDMVTSNMLGRYLVQYVFEDDFIFLMDKEITVYEDIGVSDGKTYDIGTVINTKSPAYINDQFFQGEYVLNNTGEYILVLMGENFKQTIHFEVSDLSVMPGVNIQKKAELTYKIDVPTLIKNDVNVNVNSSMNEVDVIHNDWNWVYTVPAALSIGVVFLIVKMKF